MNTSLAWYVSANVAFPEEGGGFVPPTRGTLGTIGATATDVFTRVHVALAVVS